MEAVEFEYSNVVYGKGQEYKELPAFKDDNGMVVTCWQLTDEELAEVKKTGKIYLSQLTFNQALQPVRMVTDPSELIDLV